MRTKTTLLIFSLFVCVLVDGQGINKITGPLGVYDMISGYSYNDSSATDSILTQYEFRFGEPAITNQGFYLGVPFQAAVDSSVQWHSNRIFGIIQPPSEHGVYNQPADTALYTPYPQPNGPGMIQGGQRFSRLSQLYSGISGLILDDWNMDTIETQNIRDAMQGKYVDVEGNVCSECVATSPYNKLYTVLYHTGTVPGALPVIDGLYFSYFSDQNCCYGNFDSSIDSLQENFPHKEIMFGIYIKNSLLGATQAAPVQYLLSHALDRYDDGDINAVYFFAGVFFTKGSISIGDWDSLALPHWLDSLYFPYLGAGQGTIYDCTGNPMAGANVHVFYVSRSTGDTLLRSNQITDSNGNYQFGLWAGNRNTDSTYYGLIAEKAGYITDTVGFWISRGDTTPIPDLSLCPGVTGSASQMALYPNPVSAYCTVEVGAGYTAGNELDIYNMLGQKIYSTAVTSAQTILDMSEMHDGLYIVYINASNPVLSQKSILLVRH